MSAAHVDGSPSATRMAVTAVPAVSRRPSGVVSGCARNEVTSAVTAVRGSAPSGQALRAVQRWANASNAASVDCALASERAGSSMPGSGGPSRTSRPTARGWARAQSASASAPSPVPSAESRATPRAWRTASTSSAAAALENPPSWPSNATLQACTTARARSSSSGRVPRAGSASTSALRADGSAQSRVSVPAPRRSSPTIA